ncbi:hypothetical protein [Azospirillum sp. B506]|uniref:hypothetical protein n=1 Tax=Azospirillum sp. B506 TaxID=137721 RepID=UPI00034AE274|nr:hypothetical protein [Azospirillum sp. B506]
MQPPTDYRSFDQLTIGADCAEARVGGTLRGGYVIGDSFAYCARGYHLVPLAAVQDLKLHGFKRLAP